MIYLDTSVVIAHLLAEDHRPGPWIWEQPLVSSRLLEYELWTRLNARGLHDSHGAAAKALIGRLAIVELIPEIVGRALEPFPVPLRTLDALHLASAVFLSEHGQQISLASYDERLLSAASSIGLNAHPLQNG